MKSGKITVLFLGDVNVDFSFSGLEFPIIRDCEVFCRNFSKSIGGSTCIASTIFNRLGGDAHLCGLVGSDENGIFIKNQLARIGVNTSFLQTHKEISTGITANLICGRERSQVTYRGALEVFNSFEKAMEELNLFSHVHISGPYGMPALLPRIKTLLETIKNAGKTVSLDTQWDPSEHWTYIDSWFSQTDWLFVNKNEALSITKTRDLQRAYETLLSRTPNPIIKLGKDGVIVQRKKYPAYDVPIADTTSAGDAFAAGFLFATLQLGMPISFATEFASATAATACTYVGNTSEKMNIKTVKELYVKETGQAFFED